MKRISLLLSVILIFTIVLCGCGTESAALSFRNGGEKIVVVATLFPEYDFACAVGGDKALVTMLLAPGTESHTYDPSPSDIATIQDSDIFFYTGDDMEPWAARIAESFSEDAPVIVDASKNASLIEESHEHSEDIDEDEDEHGAFDPHIWLDLTNAVKMVEAVRDAFNEIDSGNSDYYTANAAAYIAELNALDDEYQKAVDESDGRTLVFGGRFAYGYLMSRYELKYISAYETCSEEGEPSVQRISQIIDFIKENNVGVIYYEELSQPKIAESISEETGCRMLELSTAHTVTKEQFADGITFIDVMRSDLENLREGLK